MADYQTIRTAGVGARSAQIDAGLQQYEDGVEELTTSRTALDQGGHEAGHQRGRREDPPLPLPHGAKELGEVDIDIMLIAVHTRHHRLPVHLARESKGSW